MTVNKVLDTRIASSLVISVMRTIRNLFRSSNFKVVLSTYVQASYLSTFSFCTLFCSFFRCVAVLHVRLL